MSKFTVNSQKLKVLQGGHGMGNFRRGEKNLLASHSETKTKRQRDEEMGKLKGNKESSRGEKESWKHLYHRTLDQLGGVRRPIVVPRAAKDPAGIYACALTTASPRSKNTEDQAGWHLRRA